jgi:hypothetical protein
MHANKVEKERTWVVIVLVLVSAWQNVEEMWRGSTC